MMAYKWYMKFHMICITKSYIQAIISIKKSDQHFTSVSLFLNTFCSSALICMSVPNVLEKVASDFHVNFLITAFMLNYYGLL